MHLSDQPIIDEISSTTCDRDTMWVEGWWITDTDSNDQDPPMCAAANCMCSELPPDNESCPNQSYPPWIDVEVATGMFDSTTWVPDPVYGWDALSYYENSAFGAQHTDLFRPEAGCVSLFTPYTNPSTNLYYTVSDAAYDSVAHCPYRQDQTVYSGISFYNIDWDVSPGGGNGEIRVVSSPSR
jgi:hypothetical protein